MWLSNSSIGRKVVMSVTGIALVPVSYTHLEAEYFLAYKDNKVVGRIAGIINKRANETWNKKTQVYNYHR